MGSLSNLYISASYTSLVHLGNDGPITALLPGQFVALQDGLGNNLNISLNNSGDVNIGGILSASNIPTDIATQAELNAYTQSTNIRLNNIEATTASLNTSVTNLNASSASQQISINALNVFTASQSTASIVNSLSSLNSFTQSANIRLNNLESTSASVNISISNLNAATSSYAISASVAAVDAAQQTQINALIAVTASFLTSSTDISALNAFTQSQISFNNSATASIVALQNFSSSLDANFVTEAELAAATGSLITQINTKLDTASFNAYTQSNNQRVSSLEVNSASVNISITNINSTTASLNNSVSALNTFTASQSTASIVNSISALNSFTQSANQRIGSLEAATSSYAISSSVAAVDAAQQAQINSLIAATSSYADSASFAASQLVQDGRLNNLESNSASVNISISALNTFSSSTLTSISNINNATASLFTSASLAIVTASVVNDDITFTKGDGSQFTIQVATGSFALSASFAATASEARNVVIIARNGGASTLPEGTVVHITSALGDNPVFTTASYDTELLSSNTLGVLRYSSPAGADVEVVVNGIVTSINTDPVLGFAAGDILYLSSSGQFTRVQPQAPNQIVTLGQVLRAQKNNGSMYVSINNGWELNELHNVQINSPQTGDLLQYESASYGLWKNKSISGAGITTTSSFNAYTSSTNQRVSSLEVNSASVNISITNVNAATASLFTSVNALNTFTASQSTASIVTSIDNLNQFSASALISINNINSATASFSSSIGYLNAFTQSQEAVNVLLAGEIDSLQAKTGSYATTGSNVFNGLQTINGDLTVTGVISASVIHTIYETASVIFSSGSNQFGDELTDIQTLSGSVKVQGSLTVNGTPVLTSSADVTGFVTTSSFNAYTSSNNQRVDSLEANSASVNISISALNTFTASQSTASLVTSIDNLNSFTQSANQRLGSLEAATSSYVTEAESGSFLVTASFDNGTRNLTFTKGDASTFSLNIPDVSGSSAIDTGSFLTTGSFVGFPTPTQMVYGSLTFNTTGSSNGVGVILQNTGSDASGSMELGVTGPGNPFILLKKRNWFLIQGSDDLNYIAFTASFDNGISVGPNFGSRTQMLTTSGSLNLFNPNTQRAKVMTGISASTAARNGINLAFNNTTTDVPLVISGSNNIYTNPGAATAGFTRYIGGNQNYFGATLPQLTGSAAFSPTFTSNIMNTGMSMRLPVSSSAYTINGNVLMNPAAVGVQLGTTAGSNFERAVSGLNFNNNFIGGNINAIAFKTPLSASINIVSNVIGGAVTLNMDSSSISFNGNSVQGTVTINNSYFPTTSTGAQIVSNVNNGLFIGTNTIYTSGSNTTLTGPPGRSIQNLSMLGSNNVISASLNGDLAQVNSTHLIGQGLLAIGTNSRPLGASAADWGSVFVGRWNSDLGTRDTTAETVFAVGTGTGASMRKTGFLIDSGSNTFVEGTLNISGSTTMTGSLVVSGSLTSSLQSGYLWVGDSNGVTTTVATSSIQGVQFPYTGSAQITGSLGVTGSIYVQSNSYNGEVVTNITPVSSSKSPVLNIVSLSQSEYDLITPNSQTLYIII
jgi:uncharacterized coiled-coil protein SlyX